MVKPLRIFISSTWEDLRPEREAVEKALHRLHDTAFAGMEYFGSRPERPQEVSLAEVDRSHVYIGIFAHRYGSGITEAEYRRALERGIPCLIYFKDESVPVPPVYTERESDRLAKLEALKRELKAHHTVSTFKSPDDLATQVVADLHNFLGSAPTKNEKELSQSGPKYQISITDSQGTAIGDRAQVTQVFARAKPRSPTPPSSSKPRLVKVEGGYHVYLIDLNRIRHWIPDPSTLQSIARWEDVEPLASWRELEGFPPGRPYPSIENGTKPWLVKVRGESEVYFIDEHEVRHRLGPTALGSINQRDDVDILVSWKELERFPPGEPLSDGASIPA